MKDFIEQMEDCAENRYFDMLQPNEQLKCDCGNLFNEQEGEVISPNPWAMPVCPECARKAFGDVEP